MSQPAAIFSQTPARNVRSSPASASGRVNSANTVRNQTTTPRKTDSSPRKCRIQTEVQSSPGGLRGANLNVRSKLQFSYQMSPRVNQERKTPKPSPRKEQTSNEQRADKKKQFLGSKNLANGGTKGYNLRDTTTAAKSTSSHTDSTSSDTPLKISVKSMRSCFERKENNIPCKPPPSPSPSRQRLRLAESHLTTSRNTNNNIKGILSSKSKYNETSTFRVPSDCNTPTPKPNRLRRSVSTGTISRTSDSPRAVNLVRSSSQTITPKHRVKFQDEMTPECFSPVLLEHKGEHGSGDSLAGEVTNLTVGVRVRPPFPGERSVVTVDSNAVKVKVLGCEHSFSYDYCFDSVGSLAASQQDVFDNMVEPLVGVAFQGYNVCLFAYGQTGSGKSYSMMGEEATTNHDIPENAGIIPRFSKQLFNIIEGSEEYSQTKVEISYFEIFNEKIHDLLGPSQNGRSAPLRVREHPELGPYVVGLTVHNVLSFETLQDWLSVGNSHRATAATEMNMNSSRSHSIFTVTLTQSQADDRPSLCSKINLIDLAGSERLAHTCTSGDRLKEGVSINRSLLTLGKVISSLAENKKRGFTPYRESVLTWLLKESLGGNSRTAMLATISPSSQFVEETLSTLRYACQARNIVNTVRINESPNEKRIRELLDEIQRLKDGIDTKDHAECLKKLKTLQAQFDQATEDLSRAKVTCTQSKLEVDKLKNELAKEKEMDYHDGCERKLYELKKDLEDCKNWNTDCEREINHLKRSLCDATDKNFCYEKQINELELQIYNINKSNCNFKEEIFRFETQVREFKELTKQLRSEINQLNQDLVKSRDQNNSYERDISQMKGSMIDIKKNSSHDHCDSQILMLQTALTESERYGIQFKETIKNLERKCSETMKTSNHDGCEKEISVLKETISELKKLGDHTKCEKVIEKLKTALTEAESLTVELENDNRLIREEKESLQTDNKQIQEEIISLKNALIDVTNKNNHSECDEQINALKKSLILSKSLNTHVQCENRILELEVEVRNLQSVTLSDHSQCDEKNNNLFFAIEKYAEENNKLVQGHKAEVSKYKETITNLEDQISKLSTIIGQSNETSKNSSKDLMHLENQMKTLKYENSGLKKKKVEDEKKISSLEQQVIFLTKDLLDVKNQLRVAIRGKESSDSLCGQLQEQLMQQDRKLALPQSSRQLFVDDKENWETPSKVIRRSIAQHSNSNKVNERCSLVVKVEEIHQALKDAEDICSRLKIPWVFQLEPEVTTHSWFDVNIRVWDQRNMSSVRWPREVFLGWLRDMKEEIMSKSRGHKLFHSSPWLQKSRDPESLHSEPEQTKKRQPLPEEVESLRSQIVALESLCEPKNRQEVLSAVTALGKAVTQLSYKLGLSSPLRPSDTNSIT